MGKKFYITFAVFACFCATVANGAMPNRFINKTLYENIYPSTLNDNIQNKNSTKSNKKTSAMANSASMSPMGNRTVVKRTTNARAATTPMTRAANITPARRVVARSNTNARAATKSSNTATVRSATALNNSNRRVVARTPVNVNRNRSGTITRLTNTTTNTPTSTRLSSQQCFANYKECMDSYCERKDTAYNRCFCSARLAQIDSQYKSRIDDLIEQIIKLKYNTDATDAEIKAYWDATVGTYTGTNPWVNIDNALNIDWADTQTRFRGQNAFSAGHTYCVNTLRACSYMATNLRDAYKSEIERDCSTYERGLERIQMAAESVIESYDNR